MALIKCSECGGKISDSATICPHCGKPVDVDECRVSGAGKKSRTIEHTKTIIFVIVIVAVVVFVIIPKVFLHGLFNWEKHFKVEMSDTFVGEKSWKVTSISGKWYEDVKIHFVYYSETYGNIKFIVDDDVLYGSDTIFEREIREKIDKALKQEGASNEEVIDEKNTRIEYITWDSIKK